MKTVMGCKLRGTARKETLRVKPKAPFRKSEQAAEARAIAAEAAVVKLKAQTVSTERMLQVFAVGIGTVRDRLAGRMDTMAEAMTHLDQAGRAEPKRRERYSEV